MSDVVQQVGRFWHTLRHDGIDYGDYIEQLLYLLFLKMADERRIELPKDCEWPTLIGKSGTELLDHYARLLRKLGQQRGVLSEIFGRAQSKFNNPVNLKRLLGLLDETHWTGIGIKVRAAQFERLNTGNRLDAANERLDPVARRQVIKLLILCRRLLAIVIKESHSYRRGRDAAVGG
jgi:type I restriction enzyme M protein